MDDQEKKDLIELISRLSTIADKNLAINNLIIKDGRISISVNFYKALTALRYAINKPSEFSNNLIRKLIFCEDGKFLIDQLSPFLTGIKS